MQAGAPPFWGRGNPFRFPTMPSPGTISGRSSTIHKGQDFGLGAGTHGLRGDLAALHDHQSGNAADAKLGGKIKGLVHINLADLHIAPLPGDLLQNGSNHPAGTAPGGKEVQQNGAGGFQDLTAEIITGNMDDGHCNSSCIFERFLCTTGGKNAIICIQAIGPCRKGRDSRSTVIIPYPAVRGNQKSD